MCHKDGPVIKSLHGPSPQPSLVGSTLEGMRRCLRRALAKAASRAAGGSGLHSEYSLEETDARQRSLLPQRCELCVDSHGCLGAYVSVCVPEGSVGMLGVCSAYMLVFVVRCEPVCPGVCVIV